MIRGDEIWWRYVVMICDYDVVMTYGHDMWFMICDHDMRWWYMVMVRCADMRWWYVVRRAQESAQERRRAQQSAGEHRRVQGREETARGPGQARTALQAIKRRLRDLQKARPSHEFVKFAIWSYGKIVVLYETVSKFTVCNMRIETAFFIAWCRDCRCKSDLQRDPF